MWGVVAAPPLEANTILLSMARPADKIETPMANAMHDRISYLCAKAVRDIHDVTPEEYEADGVCGKLDKAMHGTRDAAQCGGGRVG